MGLSNLNAENFSRRHTGLSLGFDAGILYELNAHGEIELGLKYAVDSVKLTLVNNANIKVGDLEFEFKHFGAIIGYNYKF